jgi:protoheme IX farnesyltransferase
VSHAHNASTAASIPAALSTASSTTSNQIAQFSLKRLMGDYKMLSKFKLSALVVLTSAGGFVAGSGESIDYTKLVWTSLGTFGASACANTLNQLYEVSNDSRMTRTCNRPLPAGRLSRVHAGAFAVTMGLAGVSILYEQVCASVNS